MIAAEKLSILEYPRIARDIRYWHVLRGFCVEYQDITRVSVLIKSSLTRAELSTTEPIVNEELFGRRYCVASSDFRIGAVQRGENVSEEFCTELKVRNGR